MLKRRNMRIILIVCGFMGAMLGMFFGKMLHHRHSSFDLSQLHGTYLNTPRAISAFSLMGIDHQPFTNVSLKNQWTLLFFGFSHCESVCPTTMAELARVYQLLESKQSPMLPRVVMVSIDPERDNLERLGHFVKAFNPHFYGARAEESVIHDFAQQFGVSYAKITRQRADSGDDIEHTGALMLVNPEGQLAAFYTMPHHAESIADDLMVVFKGARHL